MAKASIRKRCPCWRGGRWRNWAGDWRRSWGGSPPPSLSRWSGDRIARPASSVRTAFDLQWAFLPSGGPHDLAPNAGQVHDPAAGAFTARFEALGGAAGGAPDLHFTAARGTAFTGEGRRFLLR